MVTHLVKLSRVPLCFIRMVQSDVGDGRSLYGITCNIFTNGSCFALLTTVSRLFNNNTISTINTTTLNKFPRASVHPGTRGLEITIKYVQSKHTWNTEISDGCLGLPSPIAVPKRFNYLWQYIPHTTIFSLSR